MSLSHAAGGACLQDGGNDAGRFRDILSMKLKEK
jgi:hypothetical protein